MLHVIDVVYAGDFRLQLTFSNGCCGIADLAEVLTGPVFQVLQSRDVFSRFRLEGHTVVWENGADLAPEYLHQLVVAANHDDNLSEIGVAIHE